MSKSTMACRLALAAALCGCAQGAADAQPGTTPQAVAPPAAPAAGSIRMTIRLAPGGAEVISRVATAQPVQRRDPYRNEPTFFRVVDARGRTLAERGFRLETELRAEAPAADGTLTGAHVPIAAPIVSILAPALAEAAAIRLYRRDPAAPSAEPELLAEVKP